ncbi:unnamed protein product [Discula destructiva]
MPVELRKRVAKAPPPAPEPPKKKAAKAKAAEAAPKPKADDAPAPALAPAAKTKTNGAGASKTKVAVGDTVDLATFGASPVTLNDGTETTLAALVEQSAAGVVLFTYPKASTPGCTTQACLFRDSYEPLTQGGLAIYGLSRDSPKSNTTFREKQKLPYPLICDPKAALISAIGLSKAPAGTQRGVFVVDKKGKVLVAEPGGPAATLAAVKKLVEEAQGDDSGAAAAEPEAKVEAEAEAEVEAEVESESESKDKAEAGEEKTNGGATEEDKEVEKAEAEGI